MHLIRDPEIRKRKWYEWADSDALSLLRSGDRAGALKATETVWGSEVAALARLQT